MTTEEFIRHKKQLYNFYKSYSDFIHDFNIWRLISRVKGMLHEKPTVVKEAKMNEIRALQRIDWNIEIERCELVERAICELVKINETAGMDDEDRAFIKTTAMAVEETLQRKFKIEDLVDKMSK